MSNFPQKVGIVLNDLGASECVFLSVKSINTVARDRIDIIPMVFFYDLVQPSVKLLCPSFNVQDGFSFSGTLILTSAESLFFTDGYNRSQKVFYCSDLTLLNNKEYVDYLIKTQMPVICRWEDYKPELSKFGINVLNKTTEDFDIISILTISGEYYGKK